MRKCVNHVLGIRCKLSVDKLNSLILMRLRVRTAHGPLVLFLDGPRDTGAS